MSTEIRDPNRIYYEDKGLVWSISLEEKQFLNIVEDGDLEKVISF